MLYALRLLTLESNPVLFRWPLQERRGERSRTICSCDHMNTWRDSQRDSPFLATGLVSSPPVGIFVVVGEDTNNGRWPNVDLKCIAVVGGENSSTPLTTPRHPTAFDC